jgi:hypothetical protein
MIVKIHVKVTEVVFEGFEKEAKKVVRGKNLPQKLKKIENLL